MPPKECAGTTYLRNLMLKNCLNCTKKVSKINTDELSNLGKIAFIFFPVEQPSVQYSLFDLFRHGGKSGHLFVLEFVPVLIWTLVISLQLKGQH